MQRIHVAVATVNQTPFAWKNNEDNIRSAIREAKARGAKLIVLPELCITGYGCEDMFQAPALHDRAWQMLEEITREETAGIAVTLGLPIAHRGGVYNCAALCVDGKIVGLVAKKFLAGDGIHYEPRWFKAWPDGIVTHLVRQDGGGQATNIPIGDLAFDVGGLILGFEICEDAWVASRPGARLSEIGVDIILNPSASHFAFGKQNVRRQIVVEGSRAFGVTYLYANLIGNESGRALYDGGGIIASAGVAIAETTRFSFKPWQVVDAIVDVSLTRLARSRSASFRPNVDASDENVVTASMNWPAVPPMALASIELRDHSKEESFARIMAVALFDYMRKSKSKGFVVSLSGGADSSACAVLVKLMVTLAREDLGTDGFKSALNYIEGIQSLPSSAADEDFVKHLLTTAYQSTRNSGDVTRHAARTVATLCGADHHELDIDAMVQGYVSMVETSLGRKLSWETDDIALQNIQARVRGPSVWMFANLRNQLLLATSNRSEAAVGYATMDGDTCGGLSPLAGIDKAFLRSWLRWMQSTGIPSVAGAGPMTALSCVTVQAPTAELRPSGQGQTDEGDLMPYPILDEIEGFAIRDKKMPLEAFDEMHARHPDVPVATMKAWVDKFYRMWARNQWKRERYAPSFHLDDKNLDPKTWCRFPILCGTYSEELEALKQAR